MDLLKKTTKVFEKFKGEGGEGGSKKTFENVVIVLIIGVIAIIAGSYFLRVDDTQASSGDKSKQQTTKDNLSEQNDRIAQNSSQSSEVFKQDESEKVFEAQVSYILSQIEGAGRVSVMITYVSGKESIHAIDIKKRESSTNEKDKEGGTRNIGEAEYENETVYEERGSDKLPVVVKELMPQVKGVVVVAEGAGEPIVKEKLAKSVQVLLDVPTHRIQIVERRKGG